METMSKFKVGNEIVRINDLRDDIKIGFKTIVRTGYCYKTPSGELVDIIDRNWELANPKWTIYNNTLPWSQLSDKQKGKLLLAAHAKMLFCDFGLQIPEFALVNCVYKVEEAAKPEPTMAELFEIDMGECVNYGTERNSNLMIAKGWTKPCK
jgi:hypothetical protein